MRLTLHQVDMAIAALRAVLQLKGPADGVLRNFFRENHKLGVNDRAFIADTVFGVLRHFFSLKYITGTTTPRPLFLAYLVKFRGINLRELMPFITETEIKRLVKIKAVRLDSLPSAIRSELPEWLVEKMQAKMPDTDILTLGLSLQQPASLDLRVNTLIANRNDVLTKLIKDGIDAKTTLYSPIGIRLVRKLTIQNHDMFIAGKIEIQDEGSQLLGYLLQPKRGEIVVDFCAGAGGKALMMGALMSSKGRIYAFDVSEKRLNNLKPRLKRSGLSNLFPRWISNENDVRVKRLTGKVDRVLVDAPCSGLGTLRRNPDIKLRQTPQNLEETKRCQEAILTSSAKLLKPGGRLVYATCSFLPEENQEIIENFLTTHTQFTLLNCGELFMQQKIPLDTGMFLQLLPSEHNTDSFFAAALTLARND
jgi:16S rRNA (cytosine967-C5)-methyltransferase